MFITHSIVSTAACVYFDKDNDFLAFEQILAEGAERFSMCICGYCIMGNHWHLLLWLHEDGNLSELERIEMSVKRSATFGKTDWTERTAGRLKLQSTLRPKKGTGQIQAFDSES
jgi:REP element-mobilizing transposase RayT